MQNLITFRENSRRITNCCLRFVIQTIISLTAFSTFPQFKSVAQVSSREQFQKTTSAFRQKLEQWKTDTNLLFTVQAQSINDWKNCTDSLKEMTVIRFYEPTNTFIIKTKPSVLKNLLQCKGVLFADDIKQPKEELLLGFVDYAVNGISLLQSNHPQFNGNGFNVSVKENRFDTSDIDFKGRILNAPFASTIVSGHASAMATIIAGGGNNWNYTKVLPGMLPYLPPAFKTSYRKHLLTTSRHPYMYKIILTVLWLNIFMVLRLQLMMHP